LNPLIVKILRFIGFLAIALLLLYFAFKGISIENIFNDLKTVKYSWVLLSLVFAFIAYLSRAYRWNLIIEALNYKPPFASTFYSLMVGYLANFAFPRIGEVTRCASLAKKEKIPVDKLLGTVIVERAVDMLSLFIFLIFLLFFRLDKFGSFLGNNVLKPLQEKVIETLTFSWIIWILLIALMISGIASYFVFREQISSMKGFTKLKNIVKGVIDGLKSIYKMKRRWEFLFHTIFIWTMYLLMTWVVVFSIPSTSHLTIIDSIFILVIGGLGMSAPVQAGIGAYHWIVSRGLAVVYPTAVSLEEGLVFATISHESQALLIILLGTISLFLLVKKKKINTVSASPIK
jgi:uncharacterized protein (TIRG00374 family)